MLYVDPCRVKTNMFVYLFLCAACTDDTEAIKSHKKNLPISLKNIPMTHSVKMIVLDAGVPVYIFVSNLCTQCGS